MATVAVRNVRPATPEGVAEWQARRFEHLRAQRTNQAPTNAILPAEPVVDGDAARALLAEVDSL